MNKIKASIVVIGFQEENSGMYPHLSDFLQNLRASFEEVIYIGDDDRGEHLYLIEYYLNTVFTYFGLRKQIANSGTALKQVDTSGTSENKSLSIGFLSHLMKKVFKYSVKQLRLIWKIRNLKFSHGKKIIIAIDHTATYFAAKNAKGCQIIFWSFDVLAEDAPWRIKNGFLEKLITSGHALQTDLLMIQDANRKNILEKSVGKAFKNTLYLPVSLNDSDFCRFAADKRACKSNFDMVRIIQSGLLSEIRFTSELLDIYQQWPPALELYLHGVLCGNAVNSKMSKVEKKPRLSSEMYDVEKLKRFLDTFDIGFVGYGETDINHSFVENASTQLVGFLRLGIPVIVCGSPSFRAFIEMHNVGIAIESLNDMVPSIRKITDNYAFYSGNARKLYQNRFNLNSIFESYLVPAITAIL